MATASSAELDSTGLLAVQVRAYPPFLSSTFSYSLCKFVEHGMCGGWLCCINEWYASFLLVWCRIGRWGSSLTLGELVPWRATVSLGFIFQLL